MGEEEGGNTMREGEGGERQDDWNGTRPSGESSCSHPGAQPLEAPQPQ